MWIQVVAAAAAAFFSARPGASGGAGGPATPPTGGCPALARSVVVHRAARFTVLSPRVIRIEAEPFDDRCSFGVVSRASPTAASTTFSTRTGPGGAGLEIETAGLLLRYTPAIAPTGATSALPPPPPPPMGCSSALRNNTDCVGCSRAPGAKPLTVASLSVCCQACHANRGCGAFIFAPGSDPTPTGFNCWLMQPGQSSRFQPRQGRVVGNVAGSGGSGPFSPSTLSIALKGVPAATWRPGDQDTGNLKGTISSWNEVKAFQQPLADGLQPGVLSRSGWTLLDDTFAPRFSNSSSDQGDFFLGEAPFVDLSSLGTARAAASVVVLAAYALCRFCIPRRRTLLITLR